MKKILIVEDHKKIRDELSLFLSHSGYLCEAPEDFSDVIGKILTSAPHLVLLDLNLPVYDGCHICREVRKKSEVPIIVVTSRNTEIDELTAMNLGADDFITKPYNTQILLARIETLLRRVYRETPVEKLNCDSFLINLGKSTLEIGAEVLELTKNELRIMTCLYEKRGSIVSRDDLIRSLWDSELFVDDNTLTVNMTRLRRKLEEAGLNEVITTKRGRGYLLR